ncbi:MAG: sulfite exporter TauE/SafE family protein [Pseudomonadota bacterium]
MDISLAFYVTAVCAVLITGISKSGFGGGLGVMAVPLMSLFAAPQFAAAVMMPILIAMDVLIVVRYRKSWNRSVVLALLPGAMVGLALGGLLFETLEADVVRFAIGIMALVFVTQYVLQLRAGRTASPRFPRPVVWGLAATSGFASYIAHAGGPPVKGYLLAQGMEKSAFVGTNTVFFFALNGIKTVAYGTTGTMDWDSVSVSLFLAPWLLVGVFVGGWLHSRVDQTVFVRLVYVFLALTAVRLLSDSVPKLFLV